MTRLIDADDIKVHISELMLVYSGEELNNAILNAIDNAPTVEERPQEVYLNGKDYDLYLEGYKQAKKDFERPQGKWIYDYDDFYHCSICGKGICTEWDKLSLKKYFPFCHCGADMKGGVK